MTEQLIQEQGGKSAEEQMEETAQQIFESAEVSGNDAYFKVNNTTLKLVERERSFTSVLDTMEEEVNSTKPISTALYLAAKMEMQKRVNKSKQPKEYRFSTSNPKLALWADSTGREIFQWLESKPLRSEYLDAIQNKDEEGGILPIAITFLTVIRPE